MDNAVVNIDRINQPMLNINPAGIESIQITNKHFIPWGSCKRIIRQNL